MRLVVLGGGESGVGTAFLAKKQGWTVFVSDRGEVKEDNQIELINLGVEWEQGTHSVERILSADLIVKSPGIPSTVSLIQQAKNKGIPVVSEIEFAVYYSNAKTI